MQFYKLYILIHTHLNLPNLPYFNIVRSTEVSFEMSALVNILAKSVVTILKSLSTRTYRNLTQSAEISKSDVCD